jgi:hypothetical protein
MNPAHQAEVTADRNALPHTRITTQGSEARVFTAGLDDLTTWWHALGGHFTCKTDPDDPGMCRWTLHTRTDPQNPKSTPLPRHALALHTHQIKPPLTDRHPPPPRKAPPP